MVVGSAYLFHLTKKFECLINFIAVMLTGVPDIGVEDSAVSAAIQVSGLV